MTLKEATLRIDSIKNDGFINESEIQGIHNELIRIVKSGASQEQCLKAAILAYKLRKDFNFLVDQNECSKND